MCIIVLLMKPKRFYQCIPWKKEKETEEWKNTMKVTVQWRCDKQTAYFFCSVYVLSPSNGAIHWYEQGMNNLKQNFVNLVPQHRPLGYTIYLPSFTYEDYQHCHENQCPVILNCKVYWFWSLDLVCKTKLYVEWCMSLYSCSLSE